MKPTERPWDDDNVDMWKTDRLDANDQLEI